jgi:hypothetical protein
MGRQVAADMKPTVDEVVRKAHEIIARNAELAAEISELRNVLDASRGTLQ